MSRENQERNEHLGTADLVAGAQAREHADDAREKAHGEQMQRQDMQDMQRHDMQGHDMHGRDVHGRDMQPSVAQPGMQPPMSPQQPVHAQQAEQLAPLFPAQLAGEFRQRWDALQIGFVDDPRRAVQQADELVAEVMKNLAATFAEQRSRLEAGLGQGDQAGTEDLRVALRGYRSFFMRLLSV